MTRILTLCAALLLAVSSVTIGDDSSSPDPAKRLKGSAIGGLTTLGGHKGDAALNISGADVLVVGSSRFLVSVTDEGTKFAATPLPGRGQPLVPGEAATFDLLELLPEGDPLRKFKGDDLEIDLEDLSCQEGRLYLAASCSLKRKKAKKKKDDEENAERLGKVGTASKKGNPHSNFVYVLESSLKKGKLELTFAYKRDLRGLLLSLPQLALFKDIPSKDNGIDVEAFDTVGKAHYAGLRGPVLRGNAVVVKLDFDLTRVEEVFYLDLQGLGVRSLRSMGDRIYLIAGSALDTRSDFLLYRWGGSRSSFRNCPPVELELLGAIPSGPDKRPEGLFVLDGQLGAVFDGSGAKGGAPLALEFGDR